jgi:hypothetical protein
MLKEYKKIIIPTDCANICLGINLALSVRIKITKKGVVAL